MAKNNRPLASPPPKPDWLQSIGPVKNLESYVRADWWRQIFNANYLRTDGDVVEDAGITRAEVDEFLKLLEPDKASAILDLCCGQGRHTLELARRGYENVYGLDRSHYLVTRARATARKEGQHITFREGDARKLHFAPDTFDYVFMAGNSFGYFESVQDDVHVLGEIQRVLKPFGKILIDIADGEYLREHYEPRSWEWIDRNYFVCRERSLSADRERLVSREVICHVRNGVVADQFYAERLYSAESICEMLKRVGYAEIAVGGDLFTDSQRKQDLGMMAKRILVTAAVRKEPAPARKPSYTKTVAVLLGDHRKQDKVKPSGGFDEDDFHTIDELKRGLMKLKDYHFIYFDRHDTLVADLQKNKQKVNYVLNLCDEGFNNFATQELHVPALLDLLEIPYSGGAPQCLAYCYDKSLVRGIAAEMDIPVPKAFFIKPEDTSFIELLIPFPVIVKPNFGDSSLGITQNSVCYDIRALEKALLAVRETAGYDKPVLVEEFLTGKDLTLGIIGNPPESYSTLQIIEEDYGELPEDLPKICGYEAKWDPGSPYACIRSVPAELPEEAARFLEASCLKLFERLGCRDYARFDWRLDQKGTPRLLEVNPNPGWCWDGHLAKMAKYSGLEYDRMLESILKAVEERIARAQTVEPAGS
ncbi:MAG: methyltransferase domain-containing protein [Planctomycetes bacterium]|nr:methyltransferase domain-containing protein [Planctomycetota bacterium]